MISSAHDGTAHAVCSCKILASAVVGMPSTARSSSPGSAALLLRLTRLQHALETEKKLSKRAEEELAELRRLARSSARSPRLKAHVPAYISADLVGICARPTRVVALAGKGQPLATEAKGKGKGQPLAT